MAVLVDWQLKARIDAGRLGVLPLGVGAIQPNSIDVRLGNSFATYSKDSVDVTLDPYDEDSTRYGLESSYADQIVLDHNAFLLAETMEKITLPGNVCAILEGKSSLARLGLTVHQTGGYIDCGFEGTITLELTNVNARPILLYAGMPIAQLVFFETEHAQMPYNERVTAKYNKQSGATGSRFFKNDPVVWRP